MIRRSLPSTMDLLPAFLRIDRSVYVRLARYCGRRWSTLPVRSRTAMVTRSRCTVSTAPSTTSTMVQADVEGDRDRERLVEERRMTQTFHRAARPQKYLSRRRELSHGRRRS